MSSKWKDIPLSETGFEHKGSETTQLCEHRGCLDAGLYRAPRSRQNDNGHFWFCLEHIRAFNASWDFFADWDEKDIEDFRREAITGHRPTWKFGHQNTPWGKMRVKDPFDIWPGRASNEAVKSTQPMPEEQRQALAILNLDGTASLQEIKMRYKQLVKRFHPDVNGGDKKAEESFKAVGEAYDHLLSCGYY
jgi:DnaJ-domain-containing protein 1